MWSRNTHSNSWMWFLICKNATHRQKLVYYFFSSLRWRQRSIAVGRNKAKCIGNTLLRHQGNNTATSLRLQVIWTARDSLFGLLIGYPKLCDHFWPGPKIISYCSRFILASRKESLSWKVNFPTNPNSTDTWHNFLYWLCFKQSALHQHILSMKAEWQLLPSQLFWRFSSLGILYSKLPDVQT